MSSTSWPFINNPKPNGGRSMPGRSGNSFPGVAKYTSGLRTPTMPSGEFFITAVMPPAVLPITSATPLRALAAAASKPGWLGKREAMDFCRAEPLLNASCSRLPAISACSAGEMTNSRVSGDLANCTASCVGAPPAQAVSRSSAKALSRNCARLVCTLTLEPVPLTPMATWVSVKEKPSRPAGLSHLAGTSTAIATSGDAPATVLELRLSLAGTRCMVPGESRRGMPNCTSLDKPTSVPPPPAPAVLKNTVT